MVTLEPLATAVGISGSGEEYYAQSTPVNPQHHSSRSTGSRRRRSSIRGVSTGDKRHEDVPDDVSSTLIASSTAAPIKAYVIDSDDESENSEISALNVDILPTRNETAQKARSKLRRYTIFSIMFIILLATAIMVPLYFTVLKTDPPDTSDAPSNIPSVAPSQAPSEALYAVYVDKMSEISNPTMLMTPGTAQYKAMRWLYHHDPAGRRDLDDERLFQRYIAAVFYYSTSKGRGWYDCYPGDVACTSNSKQAWFSSWDECDWYGFVECDANRFVTKFVILNNQNGAGHTLHGNGLHGTLPSELGYLTTLTTLTIARNPLLTSSIPSTFSKLTRLRTLSLPFNNLEGPWTAGLLDNMTDLDGLYLKYNNFNMTLPVDVSNRTSLGGIGLAGNKIHGSIPSEYGDLYKLAFLELDNNDLTGTIPTEIFPSNVTRGLLALRYLDLQSNSLSGNLPDDIGNLKLIDQLYLSNNALNGTLPTSIGNIGKDSEEPKYIHLDRNQFSGIIPSELGDIYRLSSLNLTENELVGNATDAVCSNLAAQLKSFSADCDEVICACCTPACY